MSQTKIDFAVLGASPQARLLAGLLRSNHNKSVLYQGESQSGYRLPRGIDLSVAPITRPHTWAMLATLAPEASKLIARIGGRTGLSRVDPIFFAATDAGMDAVGHLQHMAQAFKLAAERVPAALLGPERKGVLFRDARLLHRASLEPALDSWLDKLGVLRLGTETPVTLRPYGSAHARFGDGEIEIAQTILADDTAIIAHLPDDIWPSLLVRQIASTILTEPTRLIATALMYQLDTGIVLAQQARGGIAALGPGSMEQFSEAVRVLLGPERAMRQAGQSSYQRILSVDGAPAVGRVGGIGPDLIAGFGGIGAFFTPALARWLSGAATPAENAWLSAHLIDRDPLHSHVADLGAQT